MINRVDRVEQWLFVLDLPRLNEQEALYLIDPPEKQTVCEVFDDLIVICKKRYKDNYFWPDFGILGVPCKIPPKEYRHRPRTFAIGIKR